MKKSGVNDPRGKEIVDLAPMTFPGMDAIATLKQMKRKPRCCFARFSKVAERW